MTPIYPRPAALQLGGIAHLARLIDKVRLRHAGQILDYNYLTVGFDRYLLDFLALDATAFEQQVEGGGTDLEIVAWIHRQMAPRSVEELTRWNTRIQTGGPTDEVGRTRFQERLAEVAQKRGVSVATLPQVTTWADLIELDEDRL